MPKFSFVAMTPDGTHVRGNEEGETAQTVYDALVGKELHPLQVVPKQSIFHFELSNQRLSRRELMHFSRQLAVFIRAGIPILEAIEIIEEEADNKLLKSTLTSIAEDLRAGSTLSASIAQHPKVFPSFYVGIARSAELTGNLDNVLDQLAEYIERDLEARRKIQSALSYPAIICVVALITVVVLTAYVLPRFETFFASLDTELPLTTRILLGISDFLTAWWKVIAGALFVVTFLSVAALRTPRGKEIRDLVLLKLPAIGGLVQHAVLERFCRILGSMVRAGVPLPEAMAITGDGTSNAVYRKGIATARLAMLRGEGLAKPLAATGLFPSAARQMIRVGEETGTLDDQLDTAAQYYDRELDYKIKRVTDLLEPAVIVGMGLVVGFVAIALVSAMYGIFSSGSIAG